MNQYEAMLKSLEEFDIKVASAKYCEQSLGSWYVDIKSDPKYRIAHDGRDNTIVLEVMKGKDWSCLLSDKTKSGKHVIEKLVSELNAI
jgi:hypothetical protein